MKTHRCLLVVFLLISQGLVADTKTLNEDGTEFKSPRLAGDSLPIAGFQEKKSTTQVNSIEDAFSMGRVKGLIRYSGQYRDSNLQTIEDSIGTNTSNEKKQQYTAIGGYLGYETAPWYNTSVGATFYTSHALGNNPDDRLGLGGLNEDGGTANAYTALGEAFVKYQTDHNKVMYGRKEMPDYRFISLSNIRMSPFTHEGLTYENTSIKGLQLNLANITRLKDRNSEDFEGMVRSARVQTGCSGAGIDPLTGMCVGGGKALIRGSYDPINYLDGGNYSGDEKSMTMLGAIYKQDAISIEVWDYYVQDFVNTAYLYTDYTIKPTKDLALTFAGQFASQNNVGDNVAGDINTWFYGLKAQASIDSGMTFFTAYNEVKYDESSYDGGTIFVRWGTPQMFNSFQVQDSELAGTKSYGVGAQFELGKMGLVPNTVIRFRYADYNMPDSLTQTDARQDRSETTFDLRYSFTKNDGFGIFTQMDGLSLQFRAAYDDYDTDYAFEQYAVIHNYDFKSVTDDFWDVRLYIDYIF